MEAGLPSCGATCRASLSYFQDIMFDMARQWQSLDYMSEVYPDFDPEVHKKKMADIEGTNTHDNDQSESHQS